MLFFQRHALGNSRAFLRQNTARMTLKIQRSTEQKLLVLTLVGRIQAENIPDLLALLESGSPERGVIMDLAHVKLVDQEAVRFLARCEASGASLRNYSGYIREWITQEKKAMTIKRSNDE